MHDRTNGDEDYGHTVYALRRSLIQRAVQYIECERDRRRGLILTPRRRRKPANNLGRMHAPFSRASRVQREL